MPWKLIFLVILIGIVAVFVGANHANVCNISFVFKELQNVPVYVTILVSILVGMLIMLPFSLGKKRGKAALKQQNAEASGLPYKEEYPAENARNRRNRKRMEIAARKAEKARKKVKLFESKAFPEDNINEEKAAEPPMKLEGTPNPVMST
ncbi:MAG: hypothetical protein K5930_13675, partial [Treponemataceae bacterium]|nr:hypothetical protein [Treponemataceae bacterium]